MLLRETLKSARESLDVACFFLTAVVRTGSVSNKSVAEIQEVYRLATQLVHAVGV